MGFMLKPSIKGGAKRRDLFVLQFFIFIFNLFIYIYVKNTKKVAQFVELIFFSSGQKLDYKREL